MESQTIVQYLPAERLDDLIRATGFADFHEAVPYAYRFRWLLERIGMLKDRAEAANIIHDNETQEKLVALIQSQRRYDALHLQTIQKLADENRDLRDELEKLKRRIT